MCARACANENTFAWMCVGVSMGVGVGVGVVAFRSSKRTYSLLAPFFQTE